MENAVAIAALGLAGTTVGALIWALKYLGNTLAKDLQEHTQAAIEQKNAAIEQTETLRSLKKTVKIVGRQAELTGKNSQEQLVFMKALNGKLAKATIQTVQEQTVEHQTVKNMDRGK